MERPKLALLRRKLQDAVSQTNPQLPTKVNRAWHGYKYIDPAESGAILPIVHINGFKISERTIYGCMDDEELVALFTYDQI
jgi:phosphoketolase